MLTEARSSRERGAGEVDGVKRRRVGAGFGEGSMRRSSGLQFPRAGALVGCGPREAVREVKKPTTVLNCGKNLTHRRWVSGEIQEDGAVQGLRRWPRVWQNRLNYPGSSAQTITIKATLAQTHFKRNNSGSVG